VGPDTPLWRQIHPSFVENSLVGSQAFRPTPKDRDLLSFEDGDRITAESSWKRFTVDGHLRSVGVLSVSVEECTAQSLRVEADGIGVPEHVSVDFAGKPNGMRKTISKLLRDQAVRRGWQFHATQAKQV